VRAWVAGLNDRRVGPTATVAELRDRLGGRLPEHGEDPVATVETLSNGAERRARGFAVWAAIRPLGRDGVAELVGRTCDLALRFAQGLERASGLGIRILNDVVLNQVLVRFDDPRVTGPPATPAPTW
jgi:glutamate/tyrosine decarboxylase-like PLP-dependent enzyme